MAKTKGLDACGYALFTTALVLALKGDMPSSWLALCSGASFLVLHFEPALPLNERLDELKKWNAEGRFPRECVMMLEDSARLLRSFIKDDALCLALCWTASIIFKASGGIFLAGIIAAGIPLFATGLRIMAVTALQRSAEKRR